MRNYTEDQVIRLLDFVQRMALQFNAYVFIPGMEGMAPGQDDIAARKVAKISARIIEAASPPATPIIPYSNRRYKRRDRSAPWKRGGRYFTSEELDEIIMLFNAGKSCSEIGTRYRVNRLIINNIIQIMRDERGVDKIPFRKKHPNYRSEARA